MIAEAQLPLSPGLTCVTGETGAGKTMVVAGLGLLFGGRNSRAPQSVEKTRLEGRLRVDQGGKELRRILEEADAETEDDGTVLLARSISPEGRSRAWVGGRSVPLGTLGDVGTACLSVHGQSDQMRLLGAPEQRGALDRFGGPGLAAALEEYQGLFHSLQEARGELEKLVADAERAERETAELREGLAAVEAVDPAPGEEEELAAEARRLENSETLRRAVQGASEIMSGDDAAGVLGAIDAAASAAGLLQAEADHDEVLGALAERISEASTLLSETAVDLSSYLDDLGSDPGRLEQIYERQASFKSLFRRFAPDIDGVLAWAEEARNRLERFENSEELIARAREEAARLETETTASAEELRRRRTEAAEAFSGRVSTELKELAMPHAEVTAEVRPRSAGKGTLDLSVGGSEAGLAADGADEVEILLRPHPGAPPAPLHKGASGGELSRVMLAIEVVFAGVSSPPVLVFDEVDAGVGGQAATAIGQCLAALARRHQVVVVTHLPQVAAFADTHLVVSKDTSGTVTTSGVSSVADVDRARELARMLAGMPDSHLGVAHAEELLAQAAKAKASTV